ncbi:MAG: DUF2911 domain-containing protein [Candidatus Acidiferrales bacterium]
MRTFTLCCAAALLGVLAFAAPGRAQRGPGGAPLSPPAKASCRFSDGKAIQVNYSSPRMRGRKIFGGLVPYGEEWRAGANEATTFDIDTNLNVGGTTVPAGNYTMFTLPNPDSWKLIISKETGEWGIPYPGAEHDFARIPMQVSKLPSPLEDFTIHFDQTGDACTMNLDWATTRASIKITEKK